MYGELIIGLNMVFNYTILSFANKMQNVKIGLARLCFASFVGAIPVVFLPVSFWTILLAFISMTVVAFGKTFGPWKKSASMVLIGALFAGGLLRGGLLLGWLLSGGLFATVLPPANFIILSFVARSLLSLIFCNCKFLICAPILFFSWVVVAAVCCFFLSSSYFSSLHLFFFTHHLIFYPPYF